jgi:hypothetical protein
MRHGGPLRDRAMPLSFRADCLIAELISRDAAPTCACCTPPLKQALRCADRGERGAGRGPCAAPGGGRGAHQA